MEEKDQLCSAIKQLLTNNNTSNLCSRFNTLRYGSMFPDVVEDCIQLVSIQSKF